MEAEFELDDAVEEEGEDVEARIDLNLADADELTTVPDIGPTLASRIIAYREEHGPFLLPEEVTAVSGIGPATYEMMRDHITATLPEELPPPKGEKETPGEETMVEEEKEEGETLVTPPPEPLEGEETEKEAEAVAEETTEEEVPATEEPASEFEPALPAPEPAPEPEPQPEPATAQPRESINRKLWITGVLAAFAGGLLGMLFALLVFMGLNGSLDLNQTEAIVGLRTELDAVVTGVDTLGQDVDGLRKRLDALEGLTARMDKAEAAVETLQDDVSVLQSDVTTLQEDTTALQQDVETLSEDLAAVTEDVEKATTFFERLRALMIEVFGEEPASTTAEPEK